MNTLTQSPASPLPWRSSHNHINAVTHGKWYRVATISGTKHTSSANMQNANFIVNACNSHAALISALESCIYLLRNPNASEFDANQTEKEICAALALAKGE